MADRHGDAQPDADINRWVEALIARHTAAFSRPEFLKAVRALSARYVERRRELEHRSPIDSAGKRAGFAALFAPLHFFTVRGVIRALADDGAPVSPLDEIIDLGSGTGVASAAWALALARPARLVGVDRDPWMTGEAVWNWHRLGVTGRSERSDMITVAERLAARLPLGSRGRRALVMGWSVNELAPASRERLLSALIPLAERGVRILIVEPLARSAVPWWNDWVDALGAVGARADEWKLDVPLPPALADLDEAAGFRRSALGARSIWVASGSPEPI
ncbi:MAG: hypothetical protein ABI652_06360 [Acidobacteriota bacterium]